MRVTAVSEAVTNFVKDNGLTAFVVVVAIALGSFALNAVQGSIADGHRKAEALEARLNLQEVERAKKELDTSKLGWSMSNIQDGQARLNKDLETIRGDIQRVQNDLLTYKMASESIKRLEDWLRHLEGRLFGKGVEVAQ